MNEFTPDVIVAVAATLITIVSFYIPAFTGLQSNTKQLIQLGLMVLVAGAAYGLSCTGYFDFLSCDTAGIFKALELFAVAVSSQVVAYKSTNYIFSKDDREDVSKYKL